MASVNAIDWPRPGPTRPLDAIGGWLARRPRTRAGYSEWVLERALPRYDHDLSSAFVRRAQEDAYVGWCQLQGPNVSSHSLFEAQCNFWEMRRPPEDACAADVREWLGAIPHRGPAAALPFRKFKNFEDAFAEYCEFCARDISALLVAEQRFADRVPADFWECHYRRRLNDVLAEKKRAKRDIEGFQSWLHSREPADRPGDLF